MDLLPVLAGSGMFIDIGANVGSWSVLAAKVFPQIHAFEPDVKHAALLKRILPSNVTVHEIALSDREGIGSFMVPVFNGRELTTRGSLEPNANIGLEGKVCQVRLATLDGFDFHGIDLIKIDVEGHEASVLEGALKTIERERPPLIIEIEERHHPGRSEEIIERLLSRDYLCCYLRDKQLENFERGSIKRLQPMLGQLAIGQKNQLYINNFVFFPKDRTKQLALTRKSLANK
jgi:FkbM family methyltransferase